MMKRLAIFLAALPLSGCIAAAPLVFTAATTAWTGYSLYSIGTISKAKYKVDEATPNEASLNEIKSAGTVAIFPTNSPIDGDVVDTFNTRSGLKTISSKQTIAIVERTGVDQAKVLSYPAADRVKEIEQFGRAAKADLVVFAVVSDTNAKVNVLASRARAEVEVNCKLYSAKTGALLLDENHTLSFDYRDVPNDNDIAKVFAMGVSDRLYELRTGQKRESKTAA
ncbi:MAG: hypothetical protein R3C60_11775 [Parvularculaceae bacterium]